MGAAFDVFMIGVSIRPSTSGPVDPRARRSQGRRSQGWFDLSIAEGAGAGMLIPRR